MDKINVLFDRDNNEVSVLEYVENVIPSNNETIVLDAVQTAIPDNVATQFVEQVQTNSDNVPLYDGVPITRLVDKEVYANGEAEAYDTYIGTNKKIIRKFSKGGFIGNLFSWVVGDGGIVYMMFYYYSLKTYKNEPMFVPIKNGKTFLIPSIKEVKQEIKDEIKDKENEQKSLLERTIDKYLPYIVGAIVFYFAFPSLQQAFRKKIAAIGSKEDSILIVGVAALLLVFITKKGIEPQKIDTKFIEDFKAEISGYKYSG